MVLSVSEIAALLRIFHSRVYSQKTREFAVSSGSVGENVLLIPDMREEWSDCFKPIGRALLGQGGTEDSHHRSAETVLLSCQHLVKSMP